MNNNSLNVVFFPHSANFGLAGTNRLQNIIYYLRKDGVNSISNIALEDKAKLFDKSGNRLFVNDYKEIYYGPSLFAFIKHVFQTFWYLYKFRKANFNNIIYFYGEVDVKNFFFVIWAKLIGYKIVIDVVEDLEAYTKYKSFKNRIKYKSAVFFRKRLNYFADGFTVVSSFLERKIKTHFRNTPVFFLPVTINKYLLSSYADLAAEKPLTVFYSGSFNEKDGLPFLLNALYKVKNEGYVFKFVLSGKGSDNEMKVFWDNVNKYDLQYEVNYKGFLTRNQYVEILTTEADVFCMTRINSSYANAGFPFKLGEFLATGKPVIASRVGDVEKYLTDKDAYLVDPECSEQIKDAIINIFNDRSISQRIGLNGKLAAMKHFDHEKYADPLKEFLSSVA